MAWNSSDCEPFGSSPLPHIHDTCSIRWASIERDVHHEEVCSCILPRRGKRGWSARKCPSDHAQTLCQSQLRIIFPHYERLLWYHLTDSAPYKVFSLRILRRQSLHSSQDKLAWEIVIYKDNNSTICHILYGMHRRCLCTGAGAYVPAHLESNPFHSYASLLRASCHSKRLLDYAKVCSSIRIDHKWCLIPLAAMLSCATKQCWDACENSADVTNKVHGLSY